MPFYWASSQELVRHRIGGPQAHKMQRQLAIGQAAYAPLAPDEADRLGGLWDVYPEGLTADFLQKLDKDAWPWDRPRRRRKESRRQGKARLCQGPAPPPPSNAQRRLLARQEARDAMAAGEQQAVEQEEEEEAHALFVNAPALPRAPAPPAGPPPRGRPRPHLGGRPAGGDDDGSWGTARSFYHCPRGAGGEAAGKPRLVSLAGHAVAAAMARPQLPLLAIAQ